MSNQFSDLLAPIESLVESAWGPSRRVGAMTPLAGDASSRRYVRITIEGGKPATAVVMIQSDSGLSISSDELAIFAEPPREMPFLNVQRYLKQVGIPVPEVYATAGSLALLEDVGDTTLWDATHGAQAREAERLFQAAIDELVALQIAGEGRPDPSCLAFQQRFDARLFEWEFEHFVEYGFTGRSVAPDDLTRLRRQFSDLSRELAAEPSVLTHRDYHSWNLFLCDGKIRVIDFQDALLAPAPYDLATLLNDRATPTVVTPALERSLIDHFLRRRGELGADRESPEAFLPKYHRFLLQKSLKIVGRFHYLEVVKGRTGYVAMLPDTFRTLRRCLSSLPDLTEIRSILTRSFPELRE